MPIVKKVLLGALAFSLLALFFLNGCGIIQRFQPTATPTLIPTPKPTATPLPNRALLITTNTGDTELVSQAQLIMSELSAGSSLIFETRAELLQKDLTPDVKIAVFLSHPNNLGTLANAAPRTQFAVLSDLNWNPSNNVTIIRRKSESISFIAGLISVNLDNNFRGGALISTSDGISQQAFANGGHYFCGICSPSIPPYVKYPLIATQPDGSGAAAWAAAFDQMYLNGVRVLYVSKEAYSPELFIYLVGRGITLLGPQTPPDAAKSRWAATLIVDGLAPLREIWPDMVSGKGGKVVYGGVRFTDVQSAFISPGKLDYFQKIVSRIRAGLLNPLTVSS